VWARAGTTVLSAARAAGVLIPAPCGGRGVCGKCGVRVAEGALAPSDADERRGLALAPPDVRLSCRARINGPVTVRTIMAGAPMAETVSVEIGDEPLIAAVDLGTTSVEAVVIGARTGRELGRGAVGNLQQSWGVDVIARVAAAQGGAGPELRKAAEQSALEAVNAACGHAGACLEAVRRLVISANTVVSASVLGESLEGLAEHPFTPPFDAPRSLPGDSALRLALPDDVETLVLPPLASFVGGDALAGVLAAGLIGSNESALYVDAGTNAEIVGVTPTGYVLASAAAGPALEGGGITSGGPAAPGGVRSVSRSADDRIVPHAIGGGEARWLTGSGVVSCAALLLRTGHLDQEGTLREAGPIAAAFSRVESVRAVRIGGTDEDPVWFTQTDVRAFQSAKAALAAGILRVAREAALKPKGISRLVLAGALGAALDPADLVSLGVIPVELGDRVERVGNASLLGGAIIASDLSFLEEAMSVLKGASHLELASDPGFTAVFLEALALRPYTLKKGFS